MLENIRTRWDPVTSGFLIRFSLDPFCSNALIILVLFLHLSWIVEFLRPTFRRASVSLFFLMFYFSIYYKFLFGTQNILFVNVTMFSLY